uniref:TGFb_propeptide domain-containing protein n=1 Tax=Rodentolepis nana TaxID=102285 RepID=A0A0R3THA3_RODNA
LRRNPSPRQEDLVKIHPTVLTVRNSGANARIPTSAMPPPRGDSFQINKQQDLSPTSPPEYAILYFV